MKISIITPSYNQGRFIEDAIQSVLRQNYSNFEHIIIDAGSTDETLDILKKYSHLNWVSEPDEGQSDALNKGFQKCSGDVIGWLNADDFYFVSTFSTVIKTLEQNSKIDGVYSDIKFCDKDGNIIGKKSSHKSSSFLSLFYGYVNSESLFIKRSIISSGILIDKKFHICMDKEFVAHILSKKYQLKYIKCYFSAFRWHDSNKSTNTAEIRKIRIREGIEIFNRYNGVIRIDGSKKINQHIYSNMINLLKPYRLFLKLISYFLSSKC